ncbi:hypothetical protein [Actinorugispora endophytica]|uniref:TLP18.3/Psb32/MOLO-1 phosphatase superfamily protein n=1 Tax=Actinorugispora endophytica TaxID=1605990 RepID=A0A4R6UJ20_9ACTN|nr:hypothetical protein [Actinorugispora endophytica]TDQ45035.1 hypothetical protein EV190_13327 [Actinorugispora endophytica]
MRLLPAAARATTCATACAAVLLALPAPAAAVELLPEPPYVRDTERVERIAAGLREDPLFVDPSATGLLGQGEVAAIGRALADQSVPVRVLVVPSFPYDESGGDSEVLMHAVNHAMGGEGGVYVTVNTIGLPEDRYLLDTAVIDVPVDPHDLVSHSEEHEDVDRLLTLLDSVRTAAPAPTSSPTPSAVEWEFEDRAEEEEEEASLLPHPFSGDFWPGLLIIGPAVGAMLYGTALLAGMGLRSASAEAGRRRVYRAWDRDLPKAVRARRAPYAPSARWLGQTLNAELRRLSHDLKAGSGHPGRDAAARSFDAASLIASSDAPPAQDLVGAIVVARQGRSALASDNGAPVRGACMANPLHGAPTTAGKQARLPGRASFEPVCGLCATRPKPPRVLRLDGGQHHRNASLWTGSRYGYTGSDLARRVLEELDVH